MSPRKFASLKGPESAETIDRSSYCDRAISGSGMKRRAKTLPVPRVSAPKTMAMV